MIVGLEAEDAAMIAQCQTLSSNRRRTGMKVKTNVKAGGVIIDF
jgi:hypothetical protein